MKKLISFILCILLLTLPLASCTSQKEADREEYYKELKKIYERDYIAERFGTGGFSYKTFDELIMSATEVVKAKCLGMPKDNNIERVYEFSPIDRLVGSNIPKESFFISIPKGFSTGSEILGDEYKYYTYNTQDEKYERGKTYYLFLYRIENVYSNFEHTYRNIDGIPIIPADDISASTFYQTPLTEHIILPENAKMETEQDFLNYFESIRENVGIKPQCVWDNKYDLTVPDDILNASPIGIRLKLNNNIEGKNISDYSSHYVVKAECTVLQSYKGELKSGDVITVYFPIPLYAMEGDEIIVCLDEAEKMSGENIYLLFNRNSIIHVVNK